MPTTLGFEMGDTGNETFSDRVFGSIGDVFDQSVRTIGEAASERAAREIRDVENKLGRDQQVTPTQNNLRRRFTRRVQQNPGASIGIGAGVLVLGGVALIFALR